MLALQKETIGEIFLRKLKNTRKSKGSLFSLLYETIQKEHPSEEEILNTLNKIKDVNEAVIYDASLARFQIERNGRNIRKTIDEIRSMKVIGQDNFKYKMLMIRKLNVLAAMTPEILTYVVLVAEAFIRSGYGNAKKFKKDFGDYIKNLHQVTPDNLYVETGAAVSAY